MIRMDIVKKLPVRQQSSTLGYQHYPQVCPQLCTEGKLKNKNIL